MQVATQSDHVTHAVLGGSDNISFGISDDPAFFQILSQSLYKDPLLAMVREIICNGWDSHIDSGRTDRPLTITLDKEKLVIRDYGRGIPHDKIGPVYAVYGASTKKNDGRQTGGFGLGCKSPFAYTDHFEVVSHHDGVRTIYSMSKSSAEKMGKPSVTKIAAFPTEESGIQITIDLKGDANDYRINSLVRQVVFNGDILAMMNEEQLPVLGLSKAENGFMMLNDQAETTLPVEHLTRDRIYVRYGNVIYPVESANEIQMVYNKTQNLLQQVYKCRLILMAQPDTISITPSRESLTMSELTVSTLKLLLSDFLAKLMKNRELTVRHEEMVIEYVDAVVEAEVTPPAENPPQIEALAAELEDVPPAPKPPAKKVSKTISKKAKKAKRKVAVKKATTVAKKASPLEAAGIGRGDVPVDVRAINKLKAGDGQALKLDTKGPITQTELVTGMWDEALAGVPGKAQELLDFKKKAKKGWTVWGLPENAGETLKALLG